MRRLPFLTVVFAAAAVSAATSCSDTGGPAPQPSNMAAIAETTPVWRGFEHVLGRLTPTGAPAQFARNAAPGAQRAGLANRHRLAATLPATADGYVELERDGENFGVRARLEGTTHAPALINGALVAFAGGGPGGADVLWTSGDGTVEDFVRVTDARTHVLTYAVDVTRVAGLRAHDDTLVFLDARARPRLRISPPYFVDDHGTARAASLRLSGCAYDASTRPDASSAIVPPGCATCRVEISWQADGLSYPVIVDPRWTITENLTVPRVLHAAAEVKPDASSGTHELVCVSGGKDPTDTPVGTIECFDVNEGHWQMPFPMLAARYDHTATTLRDGRILIVGGSDANGPLSSCEICSPLLGTCASAPDLGVVPRTLHTTTLLDSGDVVVIGGGSLLPLVMREPQGQLSLPPWEQLDQPMSTSRFGHAAVYAAGRTYVFGGSTSVDLANPIATAESFEASQGHEGWRSEGTMNVSRVGLTATRLPPIDSGKYPRSEMILVAGTNDQPELFDPGKSSFVPTSERVGQRRLFHTAVPLLSSAGDTNVMLIGGSDGSVPTTQTESYSHATGQWTTLPLTLNYPREHHTATVLADGRSVLVVGGEQVLEIFDETEMVNVSYPGESCSSSSECLSGTCSSREGVCCSEACDQGCEACTVRNGADQDGICKTLDEGTSCLDAPASCDEPSICDGAVARCPVAVHRRNGTLCPLGATDGMCADGVCVAAEPNSSGGASDAGGAAGASGSGAGGTGGAGEGGGSAAGTGGTVSSGGSGGTPASRHGSGSQGKRPAVRWSCSAARAQPNPSSRAVLVAAFGGLLVLLNRRRKWALLRLTLPALFLVPMASCGGGDDDDTVNAEGGDSGSGAIGQGGTAGSGKSGRAGAGGNGLSCDEDDVVTASWTQLDATGPGARSFHAATTTSDGIVVFGGARGRSALDDTWLLGDPSSGFTSGESGPKGRAAHAVAFTGSSVLLFGGVGVEGPLQDTWELTTTWQPTCDGDTCGTTPPARSGHRMAFDEARKVVVLFGGSDGTPLRDTWEWRADDGWSLRCADSRDARENGSAASDATAGASNGGAGNENTCGVPARQDHALAFDGVTKRVVLFGGTDGTADLNDLWAFSSHGWQRLETTGNGPEGRSGHAMAFDPVTRELIVFGGQHDGVELDGTIWALDTQASTWRRAVVQEPAPTGRAYGTLTYDPAAQALVLYGGGKLAPLSDAWTLTLARIPSKEVCGCEAACTAKCGARIQACQLYCRSGRTITTDADCANLEDGVGGMGVGGSGPEGGTMNGGSDAGVAGLGGEGAVAGSAGMLGNGGASGDACVRLGACCETLSGSLQTACLAASNTNTATCNEFLAGGYCP
jgi:hypothetical protein